MSLYQKLLQREENDQSIRIGLIGAGKFGSMFLAQVRHIKGMHLMGIADLSVERARQALADTGWPADEVMVASLALAYQQRRLHITDDAETLIRADGLDVVIDATGSPSAGIDHALLAAKHGRHIVMVNVEADVLAGAYLAREFRQAGLVYGMAYGDQPALVCEMVDWARVCGFNVVAAGKGTKYLPHYRQSTPDTVWDYYGLTPEQARLGGMNPKMFNSFLDGTKSAIEMAAISNATGLIAPPDGLRFPPCGVHDLPAVLKPRSHGGVLEHAGMVEVVSSEERDGRHVFNDLRWGVYVVFEAADAGDKGDYARRCFSEYHVNTDASGRYASLYRPSHLIGQELGISVASAVLRGEATGTPRAFLSDVVAVAKKPLQAGDTLDGEGGFTVWGQLMPAAESLRTGALPIGLASQVVVKRAIAQGTVVCWTDIDVPDTRAVRIRRAMEQRQ